MVNVTYVPVPMSVVTVAFVVWIYAATAVATLIWLSLGLVPADPTQQTRVRVIPAVVRRLGQVWMVQRSAR